jgi:hypothetical protein
VVGVPKFALKHKPRIRKLIDSLKIGYEVGTGMTLKAAEEEATTPSLQIPNFSPFIITFPSHWKMYLNVNRKIMNVSVDGTIRKNVHRRGKGSNSRLNASQIEARAARICTASLVGLQFS